MAAKELKITNDLVGKDENMYNEITSMAQIAATDLQNFAQYKVPKLPMAFESKEQLKEAVLNGIITTGDIYAVKIDVPVPRTSVPAFIGGTYLGKEYQDVMGINPTTGKNYVIDGFLNMPYAFDPSKTFPTYTSENISQAEGTIPKPKRQSTGDT